MQAWCFQRRSPKRELIADKTTSLRAVVSFLGATASNAHGSCPCKSVQVNQATTQPTITLARTDDANCQNHHRISSMAPKKNAAAAAPADTPVSTPAKTTKAAKVQSSKSPLSPEQIWSHYWKTTGHQTRLIDAFLAFLMAVGAIQFVYYFLIAKDVRANHPPHTTASPFVDWGQD